MSKWAAGTFLATIVAVSSLARADEYDLVVITPHNAQIQEEFGTAFSEKLGRPVKIRWVFQGTGQLMQMLETKDRSAPGASFDMDVFFGGGPADHEIAARSAFLRTIARFPSRDFRRFRLGRTLRTRECSAGCASPILGAPRASSCATRPCCNNMAGKRAGRT
jgi:hypothetical protein